MGLLNCSHGGTNLPRSPKTSPGTFGQHTDKMSLVSRFSQGIFNGVFRRNYVFLSTVFAGAFAFEMAFDTGTDLIWNSINKGRQWRDIKHRYMTQEEDEE